MGCTVVQSWNDEVEMLVGLQALAVHAVRN